MASGIDAGGARTFRRTAGARLLGAACALLFTGAAISRAGAAGFTAGFALMGALAVLSLVNLAGAFADRYTLDAGGIEYRNAILALVGRGHRRVAWDDVIQVREHRRLRAGRPEDRPSAIILTPRSGRRLVLDSLQDYDEVVRAVRRRCRPAQ
ncbi:MAG TPA: hypothetical protein VFT43_14685 [Candidatus Polarisedimenticolia bacterium]|nr:hypothetical protein [Candidatus Polarisedimenticolia bacterium]